MGKGVRVFLQMLERNTHLEVLNLGNNELGQHEAQRLGRSLLKNDNSSLKGLRLDPNAIDCDGAAELADAFQWTTLQYADLDHNQIGSDGATALSEAVPWMASLASLGVLQNPIPRAGVKRLQASAWRNSMKHKKSPPKIGVGDGNDEENAVIIRVLLRDRHGAPIDFGEDSLTTGRLLKVLEAKCQ